MGPKKVVREGLSNGSGKESITDETDGLRVGIYSIADTTRCVAGCSETADPKTPDRNGTSVVGGSKTVLRGLPAQETDIVWTQIDWNRPSCQEFVNPLCVVRVPMRQTDAGQPEPMRFQPGDHGRSVVRCID